MNHRRQLPRLVVLCGLPGSGKSTLAKRLAGDIHALRLCPDEWMAQLGIDLRDEEARDRIESLFWGFARELLRLGQSVILESGFWSRADRDEKRLGARALGVADELRYLEIPTDELVQRLEARNAGGAQGGVAITRTDLEGWLPQFEAPDDDEIALFDPAADAPSN